MSRPTLYRAYEHKGFVCYTLEPLNGRVPADLQKFTLRGEKLFFEWPQELQEHVVANGKWKKNLAVLFGYTGEVPDEIVEQGSSAILAYVTQRIESRKQERAQEAAAWKAKMDAIDLPVSVMHDGIELLGRIIHSNGPRGGFEYRMESPCEATGSIKMSFGLAMSGKQLVTPEGEVSAWVIQDAQMFFVNTYDRKKQEKQLSSRFAFEE